MSILWILDTKLSILLASKGGNNLLSNLKAEIKRSGLGAKDIASLLNKRTATIYDKMNGIYPFTFDEAETIRNHFFPGHTLEYLFKRESQIARKDVI